MQHLNLTIRWTSIHHVITRCRRARDHSHNRRLAAQQDQTIKATLSATSADFPGFASFATANVVLKPSTKNAAVVKVTNLKVPDLKGK